MTGKPRTRPAAIAEAEATAGYAASLDQLASSIGLPGKTLDALTRKGKGPPIFKLGRRVYCRVSDFHQWLDSVADGRIDATLTEGKRRPG